MRIPPSGPVDEHLSHKFFADPLSGAAARFIPVGSRRLEAVSDGYMLMRDRMVGAPGWPTAGYDALAAEYTTPRLPLGCFLIRDTTTTLIETGIGPTNWQGQGRMVGGRLLQALAGLGVQPEDVDIVAVTHLHADHAGTLGDLTTGEPVFPRAEVYLGRGDWEFFIERAASPVPLAGHIETALHALRGQGRSS